MVVIISVCPGSVVVNVTGEYTTRVTVEGVAEITVCVTVGNSKGKPPEADMTIVITSGFPLPVDVDAEPVKEVIMPELSDPKLEVGTTALEPAGGEELALCTSCKKGF